MNRTFVLWVGLACGLTGCAGSKAEQSQVRSQIGEDPAADRDAFATVGMKTMPDNIEPVTVSGVGLVYRLQPGTGSSAPQGTWRQMLENNLKKQGFTNLKELLEDPARTTSLVLVSAQIPPGTRKGDPIDIKITVPEECKTTSLKGGVLYACDLVDFDTTGNLKSIAQQGRPSGPSGQLLLGNVWVKAEGPIVAGTNSSPAKRDAAERKDAGSDLDAPSLRAGRIWNGGRVVRSRPYHFLLKPGDQTIRMAATVAERLNTTFHGSVDPNSKVADARTRETVLVNVPYPYRNNHYRFLLVSRQVPIVAIAPDSLHRRKLEDELLAPATTLTAAIKLEALGGDSRRTLRLGLESPSPWVRFAAAESLAYLGHTDGAHELAKLAEEHPALRAYCLKALAATDDAAFTDRLVDLMSSSDPALRYGAFIALRLADENHPAVRGHLLNQSFWVHHVAPGSVGLVHLVSDRRSEVVVFGDGAKLRGPFTLPVGSDFTVSMTGPESEVKISRIVKVKDQHEVKEHKCKADLMAVIAAIAQLRGGHSEVVELIKRADVAQVMTATLAVDAVPLQLPVQQLAALAKTDPALVKANTEVARTGSARTDLETVGVDLPADQEQDAKPAEAPARPSLSREPGRIFGPRRPPEPAAVDPLTPATPASASTPAETAPKGSELSRNPGTLFPRK